MKIINVDINDEIIFKNVVDVDTGIITGISSGVKLPTGNYNNIFLNFSFANQKLCENFNILASFKINNGTPIVRELEPITIGNITYECACDIPNEVFQDKCEVTLGVYGYRLNEDGTLDKRFSLVPVRNFVIEGSYDPDSQEGIVPSPTVFEIYFDKISKAEKELVDLMEQTETAVDNKLNAIQTDYDTFKAEKDAEVEEFLTNAEGQFMGTVNQLQSEFEETQTLVNELETTVEEAETKVNDMETEVDNMQLMNNYELMTVSQEDVSIEATATTYGYISDISNTALWEGYQKGKQDGETWGFQFGTNTPSYPLNLTSSRSWNSKTNIVSNYNGDEKSGISYLNKLLSRASYSSFYSIGIYADGSTSYGTTTEVYFWWDMYKSCTPTFNYCINSSYCDLTPTLYGSNDNSSWTPLATLTQGSALVTYSITTPFRYYKVVLNMVRNDSYTSYYTNCRIYNMYFTDVPDINRIWKNHFTVNNDFAKVQCKNVIVPSYDNAKYITENTVNNINCDRILEMNEYYKLRYNGELLELNDNPQPYIVGSYTGNSTAKGESQTIQLGFTPSAVYCAYGWGFCFATAKGYQGQSGSASSSLHAANSAHGYVEITTGGFTAYNGTDKVGDFNYTGTTITYIAFR